MNKKQYEAPVIEEFKVVTEQMLMASTQEAELIGMPGEEW